jgi:hypothetical protein
MWGDRVSSARELGRGAVFLILAFLNNGGTFRLSPNFPSPNFPK